MTERLKGKVAILFGAGSVGAGWGNGKATAVLFARNGAHVVCVDVKLEAAQETAGIIQAEGGAASAIPCDVTNSQAVKKLVDQVVGQHGQIDVLHNNVGYATMGGPIELDEARILCVKDSHVFSAYVPSPRGPVFMRLIEKTFGKDVTTRTWDTVKKVAK